jgi:F0F1-type ATP synthase assembly protein I
MTGPEESFSSTRPISVAELLAKNGTIGAPPVGGRRRRRRGNNESVTVAELTGEIPIVSADPHTGAAGPATDELEEVHDDYTGSLSRNGTAEHVEDVDEVDELVDETELTDEEADYAAHIEEREAEPFFPEPERRRPHYAHAQRRYHASGGVGAEQMSPDPVDIDDDDAVDAVAADLGLTRPALAVTKPDTDDDADELPSYLRSSGQTLFGGDTVADDMARRGAPRYDDLDLDDLDDVDVDNDEDELDYEDESTMSSFARGALVVGQCIVAVLFGAGLFIAFDQLWKWNNIVALVLSVLVILGLVVGVRVVRKTEDIGSTLIAVAVGALVTLGPLALLQSG